MKDTTKNNSFDPVQLSNHIWEKCGLKISPLQCDIISMVTGMVFNYGASEDQARKIISRLIGIIRKSPSNMTEPDLIRSAISDLFEINMESTSPKELENKVIEMLN